MVLQNTEQNKIFNLSIPFGNGNLVYVLVSFFIIFYAYVFMLKKINQELLLCYLGLVFSMFILLVSPMSGWYVWCLPYLCYFYISANIDKKYKIFTYGLLNIFYLLYFLLFTQNAGYVDLYFLHTPITILEISNGFIKNIVFSCLEGVLLLNIYQLIHYGITSNALYKKNHESFLIGIGGDSGAGKSTLLKSIYQLLGENNILELEGDGDHRWERGDENWAVYTHLNPKANLIYQQMSDIESLKSQKTIHRRDYDHDTGKFTLPKSVSSKNYIILSGLHVFYLPKMRRLIDLKIFLDTDENLRKHWKIIRDTSSRGYTMESILKSIKQREEDSQKYIQPQKNFPI